EDERSEPDVIVDILVAVDVPDPRARRALDRERPGREATRRPGRPAGEPSPRLLIQRTRARTAPGELLTDGCRGRHLFSLPGRDCRPDIRGVPHDILHLCQ